jgi:predicted nucleotidyltransferase
MDLRIKKILNRLMKYGPERVILFGSHAKGSSDSYSDIDLIVIKKTKKAFLDRLKEVIGVIKPNFAMDILVYTPQEFQRMLAEGNSFLEFVVKEGKVVYEKKS